MKTRFTTAFSQAGLQAHSIPSTITKSSCFPCLHKANPPSLQNACVCNDVTHVPKSHGEFACCIAPTFSPSQQVNCSPAAAHGSTWRSIFFSEPLGFTAGTSTFTIPVWPPCYGTPLSAADLDTNIEGADVAGPICWSSWKTRHCFCCHSVILTG